MRWFFLLLLALLALIPILHSAYSARPVGLASYGIFIGEKNVTYTILTDQVIGFFKIYSIKAVNYVTLQLGGTVNTSNGLEWIQESLVFNTQNNSFFISTYINGKNYVNSTVFQYCLPLVGYLILTLAPKATYTVAKFQYVIIQNGSEVLPPRKITAFETLLPANAKFIVSYPLRGNVELVFGGYNTVGTFVSMDSELALFYNDSGLKPFPSVFNYGLNATGSATNLATIQGNDGYEVVTTGTPDYGLISSDYNPPYPPLTFVNESLIASHIGLLTNKEFYITTPYNVTVPYIIKRSPNVYFYLVNVKGSLQITPSHIEFQTYNVIAYYKTRILISIVYPNSSIITYNLSYSETVHIPEIINITAQERYYLVKPLIINANISTPPVINVSGLYVPQYLVRITYPNGTVVVKWYDKSSVIVLPKYIYISDDERYVLEGTNIVTVSSPLTIVPSYVPEYKVILNYDGFSISYWAKEGTQIVLNSPVPLFYSGMWKGTYDVPIGSKIVVMGFTEETLVLSPQIPLISLLVLLLILVVVSVLFWNRIRKLFK